MSSEVLTGSGWRMLGGYLSGRRRAVAGVLVLSLLEAAPALLSGLLVARAVDDGFLAGRGLRGLAWLAALALVMVMRPLIVRLLLPRLGALVEPLRDALITTGVTGTLTRAVTSLHRGDAAAVSRITGQVETVRALVSALLRTVRQSGVSLALALAGLATLAPYAAVIVIVPVAAALGLSVPVLRAVGRRQRALVLAEEEIAVVAADVFGGLRDIVAAGAGERANGWFEEKIAGYEAAVRRSARAGVGTAFVLFLGGRLPLLFLLAAAPWLLTHGMRTGVLLGAVTYLFTGVEPALRSLVGTAASWGVQLGTVLRRLAETGVPVVAARSSSATPSTTDLAVEQLTFAYGPGAAPVVDGLTLRVPSGRHLAVVGPSGIGKSTLAGLVAGLLVPDRGRVRVGGIPVGEIDEAWLHRNVALLPQEAYVFSGSVRDNLAYLRPDATDAQLLDAVDAVGATALVERLGGLSAPLGIGGAALSTGEHQLIALARAYASPARIVLLDEATCHLHPAAEDRAERAFAARPGTLVVIAHRISSALRADEILVFDGSSAISGTHAQLLMSSPMYADLVGHWNAQDAITVARAG